MARLSFTSVLDLTLFLAREVLRALIAAKREPAMVWSLTFWRYNRLELLGTKTVVDVKLVEGALSLVWSLGATHKRDDCFSPQATPQCSSSPSLQKAHQSTL
jgi:hypothetical protein